MFKSVNADLDIWFENVNKLGIDTSELRLDHVGYSANSRAGYELLKEELLKISVLIREPLVSDRRVGVFKLHAPIKYKECLIDAVELIEPMEGETTFTGFEHAEFTVNFPFEELLKMYPKVNWITKDMNRAEFPRIKVAFENGTEVKFNLKGILED